MYILTENNQSINHNENYTKTSVGSNPKTTTLKRYGDPYVMPSKRDGTNAEYNCWQLCIDDKNSKDKSPSIIIILTFDSVEQANKALASLRSGISNKIGWHANAYKQSIN